MDILIARCAGLDVHKKTVVACVRRVGPDGVDVEETRTFSTMTDDLLALADWLAFEGVTHAAMESTGDYWKPVWHLLEDRFDLTLVNARHMKQVPGRKTDVKDPQWIARLLAHGLFSVATDVLGVSSRAMIARMIRGEADPTTIADEARGRLKKKVIPLRRALSGRVTDHHRFQLGLYMDQVRQLEDLIARLDARVAQVIAPSAEATARPETIPGVGTRAAEVIVAEIGANMSQFPTAGHLASWAGFCSGNNESAGKRRTGKTTKGNVWLRATLVQVARAASHTKRTILSERYRSLVKRLGKKKALVALGHKILRIISEMLSHQTDYVERLDPGLAA